MNIEISKIVPKTGIEALEAGKGVPAGVSSDKGVKELFGDALVVQEKENFMFGEIEEADIDVIEKELVRDDALGKLASSHLTWPMPDIPKFV